MSTQAHVEIGLSGEATVAAVLRGLSWALLDTSQAEAQGQLMGTERAKFLLPDFLAFAGGRPCWVEVKTKPAAWKVAGRGTFAISEGLWRAYRRTKVVTGIEVRVAALIQREARVYLATLDTWERNSFVKDDVFDGRATRRRVFWLDDAERILQAPTLQLTLDGAA